MIDSWATSSVQDMEAINFKISVNGDAIMEAGVSLPQHFLVVVLVFSLSNLECDESTLVPLDVAAFARGVNLPSWQVCDLIDGIPELVSHVSKFSTC